MPNRTRRTVIREWSLAVIPTIIWVICVGLLWSNPWQAEPGNVAPQVIRNVILIFLGLVSFVVMLVGWSPILYRFMRDWVWSTHWYDRIRVWLDTPV